MYKKIITGIININVPKILIPISNQLTGTKVKHSSNTLPTYHKSNGFYLV